MKNLHFFTQYTRNFKRQEDESSRNYSRTILLIFVLIVILIISGGVFSFLLQQNQQHNSIQNDLNTIAQLKVEQISTWRNERLANANFMMESFFYAEGVEEWLKFPTPVLEAKIKSRLNVLNNSYFPR